MAVITVEDCLELKGRFQKYCNHAEQHEFVKLALIEMKMNKTIEKIVKVQKVEDQEDMRAMFRVVLKMIGEDYSAYQEDMKF